MVLTQPPYGNTLSRRRSSFHTTMVLTQQKVSGVKISLSMSFHTTMVLTQHAFLLQTAAILAFPYHYGSHATYVFTYIKKGGIS